MPWPAVVRLVADTASAIGAFFAVPQPVTILVLFAALFLGVAIPVLRQAERARRKRTAV